MKPKVKTIVFVFACSLIFTGIASAQSGGSEAAVSVATVLAPLAAAALGIERALETVWGMIESIGNKMKGQEADQPDWKLAPRYKELKTWVSALLSLAAGVFVAVQTNLTMFSMIGFANVNPDADLVITGLVIGSGSKFTHDVIGIFSESKKLIEQAQGLVKAKKEEIPK